MALLDPTTAGAPSAAPARTGLRPTRRGVRELGLLATVYVGYALSRLLASDALAPARGRAERLLAVERPAGLDVERAVNGWFLEHDLLGLAASYYYASAHYVVTTVVLAWLWHDRHRYDRARTTLVAATALALAAYVLLPTAPPRLLPGWTDLMAVHAGSGWWGEAASAPQGLGWMTNQLAAFPSMHAGWALWVALALHPTRARMLGWAHAVLTGVVVVGTGNHWVVDVLVGWAVVALVWWAVPRLGHRRQGPVSSAARRGWLGDRGAPRGASRKVRAPQSVVVGNTHPGQPAGQCHREQTATGLLGGRRQG